MSKLSTESSTVEEKVRSYGACKAIVLCRGAIARLHEGVVPV